MLVNENKKVGNPQKKKKDWAAPVMATEDSNCWASPWGRVRGQIRRTSHGLHTPTPLLVQRRICSKTKPWFAPFTAAPFNDTRKRSGHWCPPMGDTSAQHRQGWKVQPGRRRTFTDPLSDPAAAPSIRLLKPNFIRAGKLFTRNDCLWSISLHFSLSRRLARFAS